MKFKLLSIYYLVLILVSYSCEKNNPPIQPFNECVDVEKITSTDSSFYIYDSGLEETGYAKGIKLNKEWRASASTLLFNKLYLITFNTFISKNEPYYKTESIQFTFNVLNKGCYLATNNIVSSSSKVKSKYLALDDDVVEDVYDVLEEEANNFIQIDTLDLNTKRISGKFMVSFVRDSTRVGRKYNPDYVRFFNGEFHSSINW